MEGVKVLEQVSVEVVNRAVRFVRDDQVKKSHIERLIVVDQPLVDTDVDASVQFADVIGLTDDVNRLLHKIIERMFGLLAQLLAVAQEQHALNPAGVDQQFGQGDGHPRFARARGLHHQGTAVALGEAFGHAGDALDLVEPPGHVAIGANVFQQIAFLAPLKTDAVLQGVLREKPEYLPRGVLARVVPHPNVVPIGIKNHGPLAVDFFQRVGVQLGLLLAGAGVGVGFLRLDHGQGFAVVVPQHVIAIALATGAGLVGHFHFLTHGFAAASACGYMPPGHAQIPVDQPLAGVIFAEAQLLGRLGRNLGGLRQRHGGGPGG